MIPFNAALVGAYWERLRVLRSEQLRVAGREPPSEQRSEGQPGYSEESLVHLHRRTRTFRVPEATIIKTSRWDQCQFNRENGVHLRRLAAAARNQSPDQ
jgi:hypothetical protein